MQSNTNRNRNHPLSEDPKDLIAINLITKRLKKTLFRRKLSPRNLGQTMNRDMHRK